jgi:integrase
MDPDVSDGQDAPTPDARPVSDAGPGGSSREGDRCAPRGRQKGPHIAHAQKAIERIVRATGVQFRGHDLRRTAASLMAGAGVPRLVVSKILNHVETGVTAVYDRHGYDLEKRAALDFWGKRLDQIVSGKRSKVLAFVARG